MSNRPDTVALIGTCPHCGEPVEMLVTKKQIKTIYKAFKLNIQQANLKGEISLNPKLQV